MSNPMRVFAAILMLPGLAAAVIGTAPGAKAMSGNPKLQAGLHVVSSPFINNSSLSAAAAIASNDMWAAGDVSSSSGATQTLAEHFDGTSWSVVPTPALNAEFSGVAGAASNDVWAVGDLSTGTSFFSINTLIEHWDGTSWSVVSSPKLHEGSSLRAVTAPATNNAWAVGFAASPSGSASALVEHWDGTSWSIVSSPAFTNLVGVTGVSADSISDVWALADVAGGGLTSLHWNGQSWSQIPTPPLRFGGVDTPAALSPSNVWAVGTGPGTPTGGCSAHPSELIEHWDGTSWSVSPSVNPFPCQNDSMLGVAAVAASNVWAVGAGAGPFTEHWDGTSWTLVSTPDEAALLAGMTALSSGTVVAVGRGTNNSGIILTN